MDARQRALYRLLFTSAIEIVENVGSPKCDSWRKTAGAVIFHLAGAKGLLSLAGMLADQLKPVEEIVDKYFVILEKMHVLAQNAPGAEELPDLDHEKARVLAWLEGIPIE